jgi:hypothetical protein
MSQSSDPAGLPSDVVEEAIAAFDAGNHAFGRYRHFVLSAHPEALAVSATEVRDALQEAAIGVPDAQAGDATSLVAGVRATLALLARYRAALPAGVPLLELDEAIGDFEEALGLLTGG